MVVIGVVVGVALARDGRRMTSLHVDDACRMARPIFVMRGAAGVMGHGARRSARPAQAPLCRTGAGGGLRWIKGRARGGPSAWPLLRTSQGRIDRR